MIFAIGTGLLSSYSSHFIHQVSAQPNGLLSGDSCLVIEDRLDRVSVLFSNGLVFFGGKRLVENQKQFMDNNLYECRYCWGWYQYQPPGLTVFRPLPSGYLNLPASYPVSKLEYQVDNGRVILASDPPGKIVIQKTRLFINPDLSWLVTRRRN